MRISGIKASALIKKLQEAIREHGDREVWCSGNDYPEGVHNVHFREAPDDGYYPKDVFVL